MDITQYIIIGFICITILFIIFIMYYAIVQKQKQDREKTENEKFMIDIRQIPVGAVISVPPQVVHIQNPIRRYSV